MVPKKWCCFLKNLDWHHKWQSFLMIILNEEETCSLSMQINAAGGRSNNTKYFYMYHFKSPLLALTELSLWTNSRLKSLYLTSCLKAIHSTKVFLTAVWKTSLNTSKRRKWCYVSIASVNNGQLKRDEKLGIKCLLALGKVVVFQGDFQRESNFVWNP